MNDFAMDAIQVLDLGSRVELAGVKVILLDVNRLSHEMMFGLGRLLSPKELRKASRFRFKKDRNAYLAGRGMVRTLAAEVLGVAANSLEISEGRYGKPYLKDYAEILRFNLSNCGNLIAIAFDFGGREVGIDLEKINSDFDYFDVAGHYFSEKECAQIHSHQDFYRFWTMKEALLKVTGVGLVDELPRLDLSEKLNFVEVEDERLLTFRSSSFCLHSFENEGFVFTVAMMDVCSPEDSEAENKKLVVFY
ncbi:MAG: 4'-phosphopantetheinyl transferase superfamily protein [Bacteroidota bacterium]